MVYQSAFAFFICFISLSLSSGNILQGCNKGGGRGTVPGGFVGHAWIFDFLQRVGGMEEGSRGKGVRRVGWMAG
jgi:hypothetical protein